MGLALNHLRPGILPLECGHNLVTWLEPTERSKGDWLSLLWFGYKTVTSILLEDALLMALMKKASCLIGEAHVMRNRGGILTTASKKKRFSVQQSWRDGVLPSDVTPVQADTLIACSHVRKPEAEDPDKHSGFLPHRYCTIINVCSCQLVNFGVICYAATNN